MTEAGTLAGHKLLAAAVQFLPRSQGGLFGPVPYKFGYCSHAATDCSGLTLQAAAAIGVHLPHRSELQWQQAAGGHVPRGQEQGGDLLFFAGALGSITSPDHCGVCDTFNPKTGEGTMVVAPHTGDNVMIQAFSIHQKTGSLAYTGATRPRNLIH